MRERKGGKQNKFKLYRQQVHHFLHPEDWTTTTFPVISFLLCISFFFWSVTNCSEWLYKKSPAILRWVLNQFGWEIRTLGRGLVRILISFNLELLHFDPKHRIVLGLRPRFVFVKQSSDDFFQWLFAFVFEDKYAIIMNCVINNEDTPCDHAFFFIPGQRSRGFLCALVRKNNCPCPLAVDQGTGCQWLLNTHQFFFWHSAPVLR